MSDLEFQTPAYEDAYKKLRNSFIERLKNSIDAIDNVLAQKTLGPMKKPALERAMHLSHGLAGSGTTFGFPEVTLKGQKADQFLERAIKTVSGDQALADDDFAVLEKLLLELRESCVSALAAEDYDVAVPSRKSSTGLLADGKTVFSVLLVDDDKHLLSLMALKLQQKNIRVTGVSDGATAMTVIAREQPDLIVLDINMPGISGLEVLRRLKQDPEFVAIPILMLTAQAQAKDVVSALHAGAIDYVVKPVDPDQLIGRVEKILDASRFTVVVADNDPLILQMLDSKFRNRGFRVRLADDGKKAMEEIAKSLPDLVILDRMMPGMEGLAILKQMREDSATQNIPVIILSARAQERDIADGLKRGAQDYMSKPFVPDDLITRSLKLLKIGGGKPA